MFNIKRERGRWGETVRVVIVDENNRPVWSRGINPASSPFTANSERRQDDVRRLMRAANQQLQMFNAQRNQSEQPEGEEGDINYDSSINKYTTKDGQTFDTEREAEDHLKAIDRKDTFQSNLQDYRKMIEEAGAEREELASKIQARKEGQLMRNLQNTILGRGGQIEDIEALTPSIQEDSARSLQDYITQSTAQTKSELAQTKPLEIKGDFDLASLDQQQTSLTDTMQRFLQGEDTSRARIQAELDSQPEWWESILGNLASQVGQAGMTYLTGGLR